MAGARTATNPDATSQDPDKDRLPLSHALRVRSAEYWLRLGEADQALRELEALPKSAWNHPSAVETRVAAVGALQERTGSVAENKQEDPMRIRDFFPLFKDEGEIIASWGEAKLVRRADGRLELEGGCTRRPRGGPGMDVVVLP